MDPNQRPPTRAGRYANRYGDLVPELEDGAVASRRRPADHPPDDEPAATRARLDAVERKTALQGLTGLRLPDELGEPSSSQDIPVTTAGVSGLTITDQPNSQAPVTAPALLEAMPADLFLSSIEFLKPIDLLSLANTSMKLRMQIENSLASAVREALRKARHVQAVWRSLTENTLDVLVDPSVARALAKNWDCLARSQQETVLAKIRAEGEWHRARALAGLGAGLAAEPQGTVLTIIQGINGEEHRATALAGLGRGLAAEHQGTALTITQGITSEVHRARALAGLGPGLDAEHQGTALTIIQRIDSEIHCATALAGLGPGLAPEHQGTALTIIQGITDEIDRATALAGLGRGLAPEHQGTALTMIQEINNEVFRATALPVLSRGLALEHQGTALTIAQGIDSEVDRARALARLGPGLDAEHQGTALTMIQGMNDEEHRAIALAGLGPGLAAEHQGAALTIAQGINNDMHRARALAAMLGPS